MINIVKKVRTGQSVIEIIITIAILAITISAIVVVSTGSQAILSDSQKNNEALQLARANLEAVRAAGQSNFASIINGTSTSGIYTTVTIVTDLNSFTKSVLSRVSWQTDPSRPQKIELIEIMTDPLSVLSSGGDIGCLTTPGGDWSHPATLSTLDLGSGQVATGLDVVNKLVYMSSNAASTDKDDFFIVDATDPVNPFKKASLETGPGLNAVDASGSYAYVANDKSTAQLQIINISNPASPTLTSSFTLLLNTSPAVSLFYAQNKVYIGTTSSALGKEFHVIDVTVPNTPVDLGSYEVGADVNSIYVKGSTAYLATSDDSKELLILDVTNPAAISQIGAFNATGSDDGKSISISGSKLYLGRSGGVSFIAIDISIPASPTQISATNIAGAANGVYICGNLAIMATSTSNQEFQAWNVTDPNLPAIYSSFNYPNIGISIDYEDGYVYEAVRSNDALRIITAQ